MLELIRALFPTLLKALLTTIVIEELSLVLLKERNIKVYIACLVVNIITNITMNVALQFVENYYLSLIIFEMLVFLVEGTIYLLVTRKFSKAIIYSFVCNVLSWIIGALI